MIGKRHIQYIVDEPRCILTGVVDPSPHAKELAKRAGTSYFSNVSLFLEKKESDGVIVATPNESHASIGIQCAKAGLHLLVEKPIDADLAAATDLVNTAEKEGVKVLVGHHRRFNAYIETAKRIIDSGELGTVSAVNMLWAALKPSSYFDMAWRRELGGGPVMINLIHEIDNLRYLFGDIARIYAESSNAIRCFPVEETAVVLIRFKSGVLATVVTSDIVASPYNFESGTGENPMIHTTGQDCYRIFGTEATLSFPDMMIWRYTGEGEQGWSEPISQRREAVERTVPLKGQLQHFCDIIRNSAAPRCSGQEALKTLEATMAVREAASTGIPIVLN